MKNGLFNKRIPTYFALVALLFIVTISTLLVQNGIFYVGKASTDTAPQNLNISNITDVSFTLSFITNSKVGAVVVLNDPSGNLIVLDDRDKKTGLQKAYFSHFITVPMLKPNSNYTFTVISGGKEYDNPEYKTTTGLQINERPPLQNPISGRVLLPDGSLGNDTLININFNNSQRLATITDDKGQFLIPTNFLRNPDLSAFLQLSSTTPISISVFNQSMKSNINTIFSNAQNLPTIVLEQTYSFADSQTIAPNESSKLNDLLTVKNITGLKILKPNNGDALTDLRPTFSGSSYPNKKITIQIGKTIKQNITSTTKGTWSFRPTSDFLPGKYTLNVVSTDLSGKSISISSIFSILPQGSQILASQLLPTSYPTITPISSPTIPLATPTPIVKTPTPIISTAPTIILSPTIFVSPPSTISPTIFITPTETPSIANPGSTGVITLTGISAFLILSGITLLFIL